MILWHSLEAATGEKVPFCWCFFVANKGKDPIFRRIACFYVAAYFLSYHPPRHSRLHWPRYLSLLVCLIDFLSLLCFSLVCVSLGLF